MEEVLCEDIEVQILHLATWILSRSPKKLQLSCDILNIKYFHDLLVIASEDTYNAWNVEKQRVLTKLVYCLFFFFPRDDNLFFV